MAMESEEMLANSVNQLKVAECPIAKLADEDLAAIFKDLPPFERLIVSEVCRKWRYVSRTTWLDVTRLDLSHVPTQNIHAVLKKCPKLSSISALRQNLGDLHRFVGHLSNIASLKCVDCTLTSDSNVTGPFVLGASELIWHKSKTIITQPGVPVFEYSLLKGDPNSLRRFQLSGVNLTHRELFSIDVAFILPLLESLILAKLHLDFPLTGYFNSMSGRFTGEVCEGLVASKNLRELYIDSPHFTFFTHIMLAFPNLEILYLDNVDFRQTNFGFLITRHATLRVLVITASRGLSVEGESLVPARKLFPKGFNAPPFPKLHLFLGKIAAERLRFHSSPSDALEIHPIDAPLPEFLEKEEIKPIFEGSWIASRIKEGAKEGANVADYSFEGNANAESILYVQE